MTDQDVELEEKLCRALRPLVQGKRLAAIDLVEFYRTFKASGMLNLVEIMMQIEGEFRESQARHIERQQKILDFAEGRLLAVRKTQEIA